MKQAIGEQGRETPARVLLLGFLAILLCSQTGCQIFNRFRINQHPVPVVFNETPDQQQLIQHLNQQSAKVKQLKSNIRVSMTGMPASLRGTLTLERPRRFRLKAGLMGITDAGVDVGSNEEYFWIWSKASLPGQDPAMYFSSHVAYEKMSAQHSIPIKPEWVVDALGLFNDRASDRHTQPLLRQDGWMQIDTYRQSESGLTIRRNLVNPRTGLVHQQALYDSAGNRIAFANALKHRHYPEPGISLPQRIELHVSQPGQKPVKLTLDADEYSINALYGDPQKLWTMPTPPGDIQIIDLSQISAQLTTPIDGRNR